MRLSPTAKGAGRGPAEWPVRRGAKTAHRGTRTMPMSAGSRTRQRVVILTAIQAPLDGLRCRSLWHPATNLPSAGPTYLLTSQ